MKTYDSLLNMMIGEQERSAFLKSFPNEFFVHHGPMERLGPLSKIPALADLRALLPHIDGALGTYFSDPASKERKELGASLSPDEALEHYHAGGVLDIPDVNGALPELQVLVDQLHVDLGLPRGTANCAVLASTTGAGLKPHYDGRCILTIQLGGSKTWHVAPQSEVPNPLDNYNLGGAWGAMADWHEGDVPRGMPDSPSVVEMKAGSVLFVPRGWLHSTVSSADSFALAIDLFIPTLEDVISRYFTAVLRRDSRMRALVLGLRNDEQKVTEAVRGVLPLLREATAALEAHPERAFEEYEPRILPGRRQRFVKANHAELVEGDGSLVVRSSPPGKVPTEIDTPIQLAPICRWIFQRPESFTAQQIVDAFVQCERIDIGSLLDALIDAEAVVVDSPALESKNGSRDVHQLAT